MAKQSIFELRPEGQELPTGKRASRAFQTKGTVWSCGRPGGFGRIQYSGRVKVGG